MLRYAAPSPPDASLRCYPNRYGNETRFINDVRGTGEEANVAFCTYRTPVTGELAVGVVTTRALKCGEELLVNYGSRFWSDTSPLRPASRQ